MSKVSKPALIVGWILTALPSLLFLGGAAYGFTHEDAIAKMMVEQQGYPASTLRTILCIEVACTVVYLIPQTTVLGAMLLTAYLGGAVATHLRIGEPVWMPVIVGVVVWLGVFLREPRLRTLVPIRFGARAG